VKIADGLKLIKRGWIRKPKGFRVRFNEHMETGVEVVYSPPLDDEPLDSEVTAWRYAWKLWQATQTELGTEASRVLCNILVVDDLDRPIRFYVTGEQLVYNPKQFEGGVEDPADSANGSTGNGIHSNDP
jgi:hypothetical protein